MRVVVLFLIALSGGCGRTTLQTVEIVVAPDGTDRLIRRNWETVSLSSQHESSYEPHSLVWQRHNGDTWADHVLITQDAFQRGCPARRWVSSIHSFDPGTGIAVLKIAEGSAPESSGVVAYIYSWREWDLSANREIRTIRVCSNPFEPFEKLGIPE